MSSETIIVATQFRLQEWAAQTRAEGCPIHVTEETSMQLLAAVLEVVRSAE